ncbi:hypothetical protein BH09PSE5_BH09PSE5_36940 [soil metagenome]
MHRMWGGSSPSSVSACSRVIQVTGFDASCILAIGGAPVALNANGYRMMTSKPRHQTAIQTLTASVGLAPTKVMVLDALRKQRNLSDYSGELVPDAAAAECFASASDLLTHVRGC